MDLAASSASLVGPAATGRARRSRKDRPCDACRKNKHSCIRPSKEQPCVSCAARERPCTFEMGPTKRVRKETVKEGSEGPSSNVGANTSAAPPAFPAPLPPPAPPRSFNNSNAAEPSVFQLLRSIRLNADELDSVPFDGQDDHPTLDNDLTSPSESHFFASNSISDLTLTSDQRSGSTDVAFRQVSTDHRRPAFFIRHPARVYGGEARDGKGFWERAEGILTSGGWAGKEADLVDVFLNKTLPAYPIMSSTRLKAAFAERGVQSGEGSTPYAVLTAILAHTTTYLPTLRPHHKPLWNLVLDSMEDEYRQPRLQTLQLALLVLSSRPTLNSGQNSIGIARAIGAAQLLGLHMDPSEWKLPAWEKSIRKRLWWGLLIHDKFRALLCGRPSNLHSSNYNVPIPTLSDGDNDSNQSPESMQSFISLCRLTKILDTILTEFYTVQVNLSQSPTSRLHTLEAISADLDLFAQSLPLALRLPTTPPLIASPTGVRSFQLMHLGIQIIVMRLTLECIESTSQWQLVTALRAAYKLSLTVVEWCESLLPGDLDTFWTPYSAAHLSNTSALVLRTAIRSTGLDETLRASCKLLLSRFINTLQAHYSSTAWDVSTATLDRTANLVKSAEEVLPEMKELIEVCKVDEGAAAYGSTPSPPQFNMSDILLDNSDPYWWMSGTGMSTVPNGFFNGTFTPDFTSYETYSGGGGFL
ncbi:fungal-specific transcription factor domain-domain-containing protein [Leucosporidium creatinivorum]|uniref:Fungal-specific transcription factor domain-domain-containing protein n=1 Tax=Leucosporidium creatinivorum TaxID=106004 RepID=A0A1Y2FJJ5_9BASI|nr:fungal-specific transcription factor domain-domain-containing protein [Leucosporidium creatinivorum]